VEACCAAGGLLVDEETGSGANDDRRQRPCFCQREEGEGDPGVVLQFPKFQESNYKVKIFR